MTEEIRIQIFVGRNNILKRRILMYLKRQKCDEVTIRKKFTTDNETTWNENNLKIINYIFSNINNDQLQFVSEEDIAYGIMK